MGICPGRRLCRGGGTAQISGHRVAAPAGRLRHDAPAVDDSMHRADDPAHRAGNLRMRYLRLYGHGLIYAAFAYSSQIRQDRAHHLLTQLIAGPCFMGGCCLAAAMIVPLGWRWAGQKRALLAIAALAGVLFLWPEAIPLESYAEPSRMIIIAHVWLFGSAAILLMGATLSDLLAGRDRHSLLLGVWIIGIFLFATIANWSASARAILPMAPAVGIVAARAVDRADRVQQVVGSGAGCIFGRAFTATCIRRYAIRQRRARRSGAASEGNARGASSRGIRRTLGISMVHGARRRNPDRHRFHAPSRGRSGRVAARAGRTCIRSRPSSARPPI